VIRLTIADTGIIVALVYEKDQWHERTQRQAALVQTPYLTCEPVITEACYLPRAMPDGEQKVLSMLERGVLQLAFDLSAEVSAVGALMKKYEDVPMSLADACLVRMSEAARVGVGLHAGF
jgi:predicted nucleic acid-binding protein